LKNVSQRDLMSLLQWVTIWSSMKLCQNEALKGGFFSVAKKNLSVMQDQLLIIDPRVEI